MLLRKLWLVVFLFLASLSLAHAGELASQEAINYYNDGVKFQTAGDFNAAITCYQKVLILAPDSSVYKKYIYNNMGIMYASDRDYDTAEKAFAEALNLDPNYKEPQFNLGLVYDAKGDRPKALEYWYKVLNLDKLKPGSFVMSGQMTEE